VKEKRTLFLRFDISKRFCSAVSLLSHGLPLQRSLPCVCWKSSKKPQRSALRCVARSRGLVSGLGRVIPCRREGLDLMRP